MLNDLLGKKWDSPFKQLYWLLLLVLAGSFVFYLVAWVLGYSGSISWEVIAEGKAIPFTLDNFQIGPFSLPLRVDTYLLAERYNGTPLELHVLPSYFFIMLMGLVFVVLISFVTTLSRFWYLAAMGLVVVFLMSFQLDQLLLFGSFTKVGLVIAFVLFLPLSYYFHAIKPHTLFRWRIAGFTAATILLAIIIFFFAEVNNPFLYLITYGYWTPILLSFLFILLVGADILAGFVLLLTRTTSKTSKNNNIVHFIVISGIYLINLLLIFLNDFNYIQWELNFISPFLLLGIAAIIGFVLYQHKEELYQNIFSYTPTGAVLYVVLASVCFFTIGYHLYAANDPVIEVFKTFIYYSQLGYGFMFLIYVLANFLKPFEKGMQVYKVLYKPNHMPYFTYRFAGAIAVLALFLLTNYETPMFAVFSSYYNGIGDLHNINKEDKIAEAYYINGNIYGYNSHRSSYALASMALRHNDDKAAAHYYAKAIQNRPSEQAFVNLGNAYTDKNQPFEAIFTLEEGLKKFPESDRIKNNLGLLYYDVSELDSAFLLMMQAKKSGVTSPSAGLNLLGFIAQGNYEYNIDSLMEMYGNENYLASLTNEHSLYNLNGISKNGIPVAYDSNLNLLTAYLLYNSELNKVFGNYNINADLLSSLSNRRENSYWRETLQKGAALGYYYNGNISLAFQLLSQLANDHYSNSGYYNNMLGLLALNLKAPLLAVDYFNKAIVFEYKEAKRNLAIAYSEAQYKVEALTLWEELMLSGDPSDRYFAQQMLSFYQKKEKTTNAEKYWDWKYNAAKNNFISTQSLIDELSSKEYKNQVNLDVAEFYLKQGNNEAVIEYINRIDQPVGVQEEQVYWLKLSVADTKNDVATIEKQIESMSLNRSNSMQYYYYNMRLAALANDTTSANKWIEKLRNKNPFFETGVIGLSNYYNTINRPFEAYDVLLKALDVNKYSPAIIKTYIMQCAMMDFDNYAEYELERIRELIPGQDYMELVEEYQNALRRTREKFDE